MSFALQVIFLAALSLVMPSCSQRDFATSDSLKSIQATPMVAHADPKLGAMNSQQTQEMQLGAVEDVISGQTNLPVVSDVFSVGDLYRVDLVGEQGECVAEIFMRGALRDSAPIRLPLQMKTPCYVRRWNRNEPRRTARSPGKSARPLNRMGGAQVWEIPIEGTRRRVFTVVGDCDPQRYPHASHPSARLRCGPYDRSIMEIDGAFYLSKLYETQGETCALKQDEDNVVYWVTARDP